VVVADPDAQSDPELVRAAREGDKAAFAMLIGRHRPMVVALARRVLGDDVQAADATQEATVAALVGLHRLRSPERFGAWYAGIGLNVARRSLREAPAAPLLVEQRDHWPSPEEQAEAAEAARRVRRAVATLAPGQREAVLAFYWQGLTHAEAALELGISVAAVKARLHQARGALAPKLAQCIEHEEVQGMPTTKEAAWVDAEIVEVRRPEGPDPLRRPHVIVLQERGGTRRLPIYTGAAEAIALACNLEIVEMPRPMTYQLTANLLGAADSRVAEVRITRLAESTFYALVVLETRAGPAEVDARPSDALNLALVCGARIRVAAVLLEDREATRHTAWEQYPTRAPELAAEVRQRQADLLASLAEEHAPEGEPGP